MKRSILYACLQVKDHMWFSETKEKLSSVCVDPLRSAQGWPRAQAATLLGLRRIEC
jgi:hypothetical protein